MKKILLFACAVFLCFGAVAQRNDQPRRNVDVKRIVIDSDKTLLEHRIDRNLGQGIRFQGIPALTEDQRTQLKDLQLAFEKENRQTRNLVNEKRAHLKTLQDEDNVDQKAINKTIDEMMDLQGKLMKSRVDHRIKVRALLGDEQRAVYGRMGARMMKRNGNSETRF